MPLTWDLTNVQDRRENFPPTDDGMNPITHTLILLTMVVGIGEITEATAPEFYVRAHFMELLQGGAFLKNGQSENVYITPDMVRGHIGLRCNVSFETRAKWLGSRIKTYASDFELAYKSAAEEAAAPTG